MNFTTPEGQVRLLISDVNDADLFFSAEEIAGYLALSNGRVKLAAARALEAIARDEALLSKKLQTQDLSTDGPAVAAVLQKQADALRAEDRADRESEAIEEGFVFGFVPGGYDTRSEGEEYRL